MKFNGLTHSVMVLCALALLLVACGGGGGGDDGGGGTTTIPGFDPTDLSTKASLTQENSETATGLVYVAHLINGMAGAGNIVTLDADNDLAGNEDSLDLVDAILRKVVGEIDANKAFSASGTATETTACPGGGSISASLQWTGDDEPASYCDIVDLHGTLTATGCTDADNIYMDGTLSVTYSGQFCTPTAINNTMTNFTIRSGATQLQTRQLQIVATNLDLSANLPDGTINGGNFAMNGQMVTTIDSTQVAVAFSNYTEVIDGSDLSVSGNIYGPCLGGWVTVSTVDPINIAGECPTDGQLTLTGDGGAVEVIVDTDGNISIGGTSIGNCDALDPTCAVN